MMAEVEFTILRDEPVEVWIKPGEKATWRRIVAMSHDGQLIDITIQKAEPSEEEIQEALLKEYKPPGGLVGKRYRFVGARE